MWFPLVNCKLWCVCVSVLIGCTTVSVFLPVLVVFEARAEFPFVLAIMCFLSVSICSNWYLSVHLVSATTVFCCCWCCSLCLCCWFSSPLIALPLSSPPLFLNSVRCLFVCLFIIRDARGEHCHLHQVSRVSQVANKSADPGGRWQASSLGGQWPIK